MLNGQYFFYFYMYDVLIDGYRQQLFDKLNIKNRTGLVIFALKNKIIEI